MNAIKENHETRARCSILAETMGIKIRLQREERKESRESRGRHQSFLAQQEGNATEKQTGRKCRPKTQQKTLNPPPKPPHSLIPSPLHPSPHSSSYCASSPHKPKQRSLLFLLYVLHRNSRIIPCFLGSSIQALRLLVVPRRGPVALWDLAQFGAV